MEPSFEVKFQIIYIDYGWSWTKMMIDGKILLSSRIPEILFLVVVARV